MLHVFQGKRKRVRRTLLFFFSFQGIAVISIILIGIYELFFVSIWVEKKFPLCSVNSNAFVLFCFSNLFFMEISFLQFSKHLLFPLRFWQI